MSLLDNELVDIKPRHSFVPFFFTRSPEFFSFLLLWRVPIFYYADRDFVPERITMAVLQSVVTTEQCATVFCCNTQVPGTATG